MSEMLLAYSNRVALGVLSGGAGVATMPLTNLQDRQLGVKWRTPDLSPDSTQFTIAMPPRNLIKVVALANHNLSLDAQMRLRLSDDPAFPVETAVVTTTGGGAGGGAPIGMLLTLTGASGGGPVVTSTTPTVDYYDGGWVDVWPAVYNTSDLEWEEDNWWSGKYLESDIEGYIHTVSVLLPDGLRPLYLRWEFRDANNPDGFVEAGRLFMGRGWQPVYNANYGATLGWQTSTDVQEAISSAEFFDVRTPYRVAQLKFDVMTEDEGLTKPFEITRLSGIDGEVLFMWNPEDTIHATRRQFLGRFRTLSPLEFPEGFINGAFRSSMPFEVKETVG